MWQETDGLFPNGYEVLLTRHADTILLNDFPEAFTELVEALKDFYIHEDEIMAPGGGRSGIVQGLASRFEKLDWDKRNIYSKHIIEGEEKFSESHEIDHYKIFKKGAIGLEIEWNNKDPFYDRDLVTFRNLHNLNAISLGIIITRGASLQKELINVYNRYFSRIKPFSLDHPDVQDILSKRAATQLKKRVKDIYLPEEILKIVSKRCCSSKFGQATTHMNKLKVRLERGLGNPCPLLLIGIGVERLIRADR